MSKSPKSLERMSRLTVFGKIKGYPFNSKIPPSLGLLNDQHIQTLLRDPELNRERGDDRDDDDVLIYLVHEHPDKGMKYGAKHGIDYLFLTAKDEYLKHNQKDKKFKDFIYYEIIDRSIRSGSIGIFENSIKYFTDDEYPRISFNDALRVAIENHQMAMVKYFIHKGANVADSAALRIAVINGFAESLEFLIKELRSQTKSNRAFSNHIRNAVYDSIVNNKFQEFMVIIMQCGINSYYAKSLFESAVQYDRIEFVEVFLSKYSDLLDGISGSLLINTFMNNSYRMLNILVDRYRDIVLIKVLVYVVHNVHRFPSYDDYERMIELLLRRLERSSGLSYDERTSLIELARKVGNDRIVNYLQTRWNVYQTIKRRRLE